MKTLNVLLAILVSLFVFLSVFEIGLRVIGMGPIETLNQFDPALGWRKTPERRVHRKTSEYDVHFAINKLGMRDDEDLKVKKPANTERVICLGDSFTLGYTVERQDLFVDQLEHWWQKEGRRVQVINTGTEGYSTDQEVAWLMQNGEKWAPDLVLLFAYENDIYYNAEHHYLRFPKPRFTPEGELESARLVDPGSKGFLRSTALGNLMMSEKGLDTFESPVSNRPLLKEFGPLLKETPEFVGEALDRTEGAMIALRKKCEALGAQVAVIVLPSHSAINEEYASIFSEVMLGMARDDWDPNQPVEMLLKAAQSAGLTALDPRPALRQAQQEVGPVYYEKDFHLNAHGNQVVAQFVHDNLQAMGLTPGSGEILKTLPDPPPEVRIFPRWLRIFVVLWAILGSLYGAFYKDEKIVLLFIKVGIMLALIFTIAIGGNKLLALMPPFTAKVAFAAGLAAMLSFILYKLGNRIGTICELLGAFVRRGHWYLMPLIMILLSVGSLLVVAASSPLVAPFIYTLF